MKYNADINYIDVIHTVENCSTDNNVNVDEEKIKQLNKRKCYIFELLPSHSVLVLLWFKRSKLKVAFIL